METFEDLKPIIDGLLTVEAFENWINRHEWNQRAGIANSSFDCPISTMLADYLADGSWYFTYNGDRVYVSVLRTTYRAHSGKYEVYGKLPLWAKKFVKLIDEWGNETNCSISMLEAKAALGLCARKRASTKSEKSKEPVLV